MNHPEGDVPSPATAGQPAILSGPASGEIPTHSSLSPQEPTSSGETKPAGPVGIVVGIGSQLGPYHLLDKLGEGGMGAVYKARHTKLDRMVALKVLPPHVVARPDALSRFEREMKAVGKLSHPNVVQALDAGDFGGVHYLSMEYVEGQDLLELIKAKGPMSVVSACTAIHQAALGLAAAHKLGLVHRDIKPSNLFVTHESGQIKILDMGLALLSEEQAPAALTSTGQCFGTPDYMAPEQWEDAHTCDARADLYSLGCTLFLLLVGRPPYSGDEYRTVPRKMMGHVCDPIPDLIAARAATAVDRALLPDSASLASPQTTGKSAHPPSDIPAGLDTIYRRLMAKQPQDRFASADRLAEALAPFIVQGSPVQSRPGAPHESSPRHIDSAIQSLKAVMGETPVDPLSVTATWTPGKETAAPPHRETVPSHRPRRNLLLAAGGAAAILMAGAIIITSNPDTPGLPKPVVDPALERIDYAAERKAAEALLKLNKGKVYLANDKTSWEMQQPLPQEPFHVSDVGFVDVDLNDEEIAVLAGCRGILKLDLRNNAKLTATGLKSVGPLPRLETLYLDETACARDSLEFLSNYPRLNTLALSGESRVGIMQTLPPCSRLTNLNTPYRRGSVGDEGLQTIVRHCPNLTELSLNDFQEHSLVPLSQLRSLRKLHCWGSHLNDAAIATLAELPSFYSLGVDVPDRKSMPRLAKLDQKLRELVMRDQNGSGPEALTDAADWLPVTRFANLEQLTIMDLIAVDAASLQAVAAMPRLKSFSVQGASAAEEREKLRRYTAADVAAFRQARPDVQLNIDGNE